MKFVVMLLSVAATAGAQSAANGPSPAPVPRQVAEAIARPPLSDGDGALVVSLGRDSVLVGVGTGIADTTIGGNTCTVARLRAQRELVRFVFGAKLESRITLGTSEQTGSPVREHFDETITERVEGSVAGAALAAEWWEPQPRRCRVALWLTLASSAPAPGGASR